MPTVLSEQPMNQSDAWRMMRRRAVAAANRATEQPPAVLVVAHGALFRSLRAAMGIEPNYLYRVMPRLATDGQVRREGQGWHPASS